MKRPSRILLMLIVMSIFVSSMALMASASSSDTYLTDFSVPASGFNLIPTARAKEDDTPLYLYIVDSSNSYTRVNACATPSQYFDLDTEWEPLTVSGGKLTQYVLCEEGVKYNIRSVIYERGHRWATLGFASIDNASDLIDGRWSPDSKGTYTYATP